MNKIYNLLFKYQQPPIGNYVATVKGGIYSERGGPTRFELRVGTPMARTGVPAGN